MKYLVLTFIMCMNVFFSTAQENIAVTTTKTTCIVFPFPIKHVDRGSPDILTMQVKQADHILFVKASKTNMPQTNVSVVTADGKLYSLLVNFDSLAAQMVYHPSTNEVAFASDAVSLHDLRNLSSKVLNLEHIQPLITRRKWGIRVSVEGIYARDNNMFFRLRIENKSPIRFDIDEIRLHTKDLKKAKRTAIQEREVVPILRLGDTTSIEAFQANTIVIATEKFTLPNAKYFSIELLEANGGRHVEMEVKNGHIMKAKRL